MIADIIAKCLFAAVLVLAAPAARAADCTDPLPWDVFVRYAADQAGAVRSQYRQAAEALAQCPESEPHWYLLIRAAELGAGEFPVTIGGQTFATPLDAAREAAARAPGSARIVTVLARLDATVESARRAVALDEKWEPARLALAVALAAGGSNGEADAIFADKSMMQSVPGAHTARARVLIEQGKPQEAAALARRDLTGAWPHAEEPFLTSVIRRDAAETLGLALLAAHQPKQAAPHLKEAAALGSERARTALKTLRP
jgi:hypothetical protein